MHVIGLGILLLYVNVPLRNIAIRKCMQSLENIISSDWIKEGGAGDSEGEDRDSEVDDTGGDGTSFIVTRTLGLLISYSKKKNCLPQSVCCAIPSLPIQN